MDVCTDDALMRALLETKPQLLTYMRARHSCGARMDWCTEVGSSDMASSSKLTDVPADGLCFYHCVGYALRGGVSDFSTTNATALRVDLCRVLMDMGFAEEARRMMLEGSDGYPEELAFLAATRILHGRMEVLSLEGELRSYGSGILRLRIAQTLVYDGAGHGSLHFQVAETDQSTYAGSDESMNATESALDAAYDRLGADLSH